MKMSEKKNKSGMKGVKCYSFIENPVFGSPSFLDIF